MKEQIRIKGARQHNLKNINLDLPRNQLIVFTGVSGSGKSSLAFDTIFAEGQRRYVESLSAYARQFLGQLDKPDVDAIEGLSPAISIDQKSTSHNPRSSVGTVTEIYDYLRLLFGRAGEPHCPQCQRSIAPQTIDQMCDRIAQLPEKTRFQILSPVVRGKKGTHKNLLSNLALSGFVRVRIDGIVSELSDNIELDKNQSHHIEVVIDRLVQKPGLEGRIADSLRTCLKQSEGLAIIELIDDIKEILLSENFACPEHGAVMDELSPRLFSFNSPHGACSDCHGIGTLRSFSADLVIPDPNAPLYNAIAPWSDKDNSSYYLSLLYSLSQALEFDLKTSWSDLSAQQKEGILYGLDEPIFLQGDSRYGKSEGYHRKYPGLLAMLDRSYQESTSELYKQKLEKYIVDSPCKVCHGKKLKPEALAVKLGQYNILDLVSVSIGESLKRIKQLQLTPRQEQIGELALREIQARLEFLLDVGLDYLSLGAR